ncbi:etoposide-induced protein 2.4 homolog isoform X2 [Artemia franciscana]|uniref:etoposide-induced protein 2.4 homolog isoform X2 n=1 Tax=Artemia franciscana TaxID=6661 RepID=UPI0032DA7BAA
MKSQETLKAFIHGILDSLKGGVLLFVLDRQIESRILAKKHTRSYSHKYGKPHILKSTLMTCLLNGGVFWLSRILFYYILLPTIQQLTSAMLSSSQADTVSGYINPILSLVFSALWVVPIFFLSRLLNCLWFQDIADASYHVRQGNPKVIPNFSRWTADFLLSILTQALFLIQALLIAKLPIKGVGWLASQLHMSFLYALYSFEYRWFNIGWELPRRLGHIENNWPYYTGFGLPLTILTTLPESYFDRGCLFSILFPIFIISANEARPIANKSSIQLNLFAPVVSITDLFFKKTLGRELSKKPS